MFIFLQDWRQVIFNFGRWKTAKTCSSTNTNFYILFIHLALKTLLQNGSEIIDFSQAGHFAFSKRVGELKIQNNDELNKGSLSQWEFGASPSLYVDVQSSQGLHTAQAI